MNMFSCNTSDIAERRQQRYLFSISLGKNLKVSQPKAVKAHDISTTSE